MSRNRFRDAQAKREEGGFVPLPHAVIRSQGFSKLSPYAIKLLIDLLAQYKGDNNGDFSAAWTLMEPRGWKSKETLHKALKDLLAGGWIELARQGGRNMTSLYSVTFFAIDDCRGKLDVNPTTKPRGTWKKNEPVEDLVRLRKVKRARDDAKLIQQIIDRAKAP